MGRCPCVQHRTFLHGHPREPRSPPPPASSIWLRRTATPLFPPETAQRGTSAKHRRRHRAVAPLHVLPTEGAHRRNTSQHLARRNAGRMQTPRHAPHLKKSKRPSAANAGHRKQEGGGKFALPLFAVPRKNCTFGTQKRYHTWTLK